MLNPRSVDFAEGAALDLLPILSRNLATLSGDVEVPDDQAKSSARVVLISQDEDPSSPTKSRWPGLDQSMHFSQGRMHPGKYLALAVADDDAELWENPEFIKLLQSEGTAVELHEKEQATVRLKLIPKQETDRIRKELGL
jgi:hypothetical protein